jgi:hypothetical protein
METASSDALIQMQLLETSCDLVLQLDDAQVLAAVHMLLPNALTHMCVLQSSMCHVAAALQMVCSPW